MSLRLKVIAVIGLVFLISFVYQYKSRVEQREIELRKLEKIIAQKTDQLSVLQAEWSHLTQAELLKQRNQQELGLRQPSTAQYYPVESIPQIFPPRGTPHPQTARLQTEVAPHPQTARLQTEEAPHPQTARLQTGGVP